MRLDLVIQQLKAAAPVFEGRVGGAADYATGITKDMWLATPAAYVVPLDEEADPNSTQSSVMLRQHVSERAGIIVNFDTASDRHGFQAAVQFHTLRGQVLAALLNWNPEPQTAVRGLTYAGGRLHEDWNRARLFYQWDFALDSLLTDDDGWHPAALDAVTQMDKHYLDPVTGEELARQGVDLSQS